MLVIQVCVCKGEIYYLPVKFSTDNKLLKGVIREGCLAVAGDTVISPRPLIGLRIFCNQIYLRQLCPVPGLHNR